MSVLTGALPQDINGIKYVARPILGGADFTVPVTDRAHLPILISAANPAANADVVGPTRDRFDDFFAQYARAYIMAQQPGTLYLEENLDGVTWAAQTYTFQVLANTPLQTMWMPLSAGMRYWRWRYHNGGAVPTSFAFYGSQANMGMLHVGTLVQRVAQVAPLAAAATINAGAGIAFPTDNMQTICGTVLADQPGTLYVDQSPDGINWDLNSGTVAVVAGVGQGYSYNVVAPWARIRYTNGATLQALFRLYGYTRK